MKKSKFLAIFLTALSLISFTACTDELESIVPEYDQEASTNATAGVDGEDNEVD